MSDSSGLSFLQRLFGYEPVTVTSSTTTPVQNKDNDDYGVSTLQKSQKDKDEENSKTAILPWLPSMLINNSDISYTFDLTKSQVIDFILKKWGESNKEVEEATRQQIMDKIRSGIDHLFQSQMVPNVNKIENGGVQGTNTSPISPSEKIENVAMTGVLMMMVTGVALMGSPGAIPSIGQPGLSVVGEMITAVILPAGVINTDMKGELNQLAALMLIPMFYPAMAQALSAARNSGEKLDLTFAKTMLTQVTLMVTDKNFDLFLKSVISTHMPNLQNEDKQNHLLSTAKLMMLYSALATYYEAETGWTSGQEIGDMVNGKLTLENPRDPRLAVIALIQQEFQKMGLTPDAAQKLNEKFASYLGDKNSITDFFGPSRLFEEMSIDLKPERIKNSAE